MELEQIAARFRLDPIRPEDMPMLAARILAEGHDTPALRRAAGFTRKDDPRDIRKEFANALRELSAWLPSHDAAELALGICLARELLSDQLAPDQWMTRVCGIFHLDYLIDEALPQDLADLVRMAWLHGGPEYDSVGGDERLFAAARALVARAPGIST